MTTPLITLFIAIAALSGLEACAAGRTAEQGQGPQQKGDRPSGRRPGSTAEPCPRKYSGQIRGPQQIQHEPAHSSRS
jgi:hypothetical protein